MNALLWLAPIMAYSHVIEKAYTTENQGELRRQALDALALLDAEAKCAAVRSRHASANIDVDARLDLLPGSGEGLYGLRRALVLAGA